MELSFSSNRLKKQLTIERELKKCFTAFYRPLMKRMFELSAVESLSLISPDPPQRRHLLKGNYVDCFGVVVTGNVRIVIQPVPPGLPYLTNGNIDYTKIRRIKILCVEDYHGD
jgi:hypothetical protein